jgi:protein-S-isoprenylcysteine O-methyltransferase Ste14
MPTPWVNLMLRSVVWAAALGAWLSLRGWSAARWTVIPRAASTILGLAMLGTGIAVFAWTGRALAGGAPNATEPPAVLLARGPFRFVRNPLYLAVAAIFVGATTIYRLWEPRDAVVIPVVAALTHLFVVYREEPATRRRLGPAYDVYCHQVPRWLPRLAR